jgi:hypothetical protein
MEARVPIYQITVSRYSAAHNLNSNVSILFWLFSSNERQLHFSAEKYLCFSSAN